MPSLDNANPIVHQPPSLPSSTARANKIKSSKAAVTVQDLWAEEGIQLVDADFAKSPASPCSPGQSSESGAEGVEEEEEEEEEEIDEEEVYGEIGGEEGGRGRRERWGGKEGGSMC